MTPRRVVLITGNHLCHNPRAVKEAASLAEAGFDVEVLGAALDPGLARRDGELAGRQRYRFSPVVRLRGDDGSFSWRGLVLRAQRRAAAGARAALSIEHPASLGYGHRVLLREAADRRADLYIAHSEPALWAAARLARRGHRIGVDMEDWFSQDLLAAARKHRPVGLIAALEREVLAVAAHSTCTSQAMSAALGRAYGVRPPLVVYNAFAASDRERLDGERRDRRDAGDVSIHWFSQTLGPGRGLEDLLAALPLMRERAQIHLRGAPAGDYAQLLLGAAPAEWRERISIHPLVDNDELASRIAEHDIGLALEPTSPPNKDLTVSNKLLHYLQAGLAVVATATAGHREIAAASPQGVRLFEAGHAAGLAAALDELVSQPQVRADARRANLAAYHERFCWERMAPSLVASVEAALGAHLPS